MRYGSYEDNQLLYSFSLPKVKTTNWTSPCSSFSGVQCVTNFSNPMYRRVHSVMSREMGWPVFSAALTRSLKPFAELLNA